MVATDEEEGWHICRQCFQPAHVERATDCSFPRYGQRPGLKNAKRFNLHCAILNKKGTLTLRRDLHWLSSQAATPSVS